MKVSILRLLFVVSVFVSAAFGQDEELRKGVDLYLDGNFAESVVVLEKFLAKEPDHWAGWTYLGGSLANLGREREAIKALQTKTKGLREFKVGYEKELKIKRKDPAPYTQKARSNGVQGSLTLSVEFKADGKIGFVLPVTTLPDGLTESAIKAARKTSFEPAIKNGKPVATIRKVSYSFTIGQRR